MDRPDLIDRGALLAEMQQHGNRVQGLSGKWETAYSPGVCLCMEDVQEAPSVDAEPVRHGTWIPTVNTWTQDYSEYGRKEYKCSKCGRYCETQQPYCRCGARMDGKEPT